MRAVGAPPDFNSIVFLVSRGRNIQSDRAPMGRWMGGVRDRGLMRLCS
jgi:hypothetical protein